jgi:hypothetical protein
MQINKLWSKIYFCGLMSLLLILIVSGCGGSSSHSSGATPTPTPTPTPTQYIVNYDQDPSQGWGSGSYTHAENLVYFNAAKLSSYVGGQVVGVRIFNQETRTWTFTVKVYGKGSSTAPGTSLYSHDSSLNPKVWNDIMLTTPININANTEIWAGYDVNETGAWPISTDNTGYVNKVHGVDFACYDGVHFQDAGFPGNLNIRLIIMK